LLDRECAEFHPAREVIMDSEHWFDRLNRALVDPRSRRASLRATGALVAGLLAGGRGAGAGAESNNCAELIEDCGIMFQTQKDRKFCKAKCRRCNKHGTDFCIHRPDDHHPDTHATCCHKGEECCVNRCCPKGACCETPGGFECCPDGQICCDGACVDPKTDPVHCGGCNQGCPRSANEPLCGYCRDGHCHYCPPDFQLCPDGGCANSWRVCCDGIACDPGCECAIDYLGEPACALPGGGWCLGLLTHPELNPVCTR
jgi:hypothetical protein